MPSISYCLWSDNNTEEMVNYYVSLFENSKITDKTYFNGVGEEIHGKKAGELMTVEFTLAGKPFLSVNGGPYFKFNQAISMFISCDSVDEVNRLWKKLSPGGEVIMALDKYPFSERYGWIQDRFGLPWQLFAGEGMGEKVTPLLMFSGPQHRKSKDAIEYYNSIFKPSEIQSLVHYDEGEGPTDALKHARFKLLDRHFAAMDPYTNNDTQFNEAFSIMVMCDSQEEIDYYWEKLGQGSDPRSQVCGWLKDKYGVSWQVSSRIVDGLIRDNSENSKRATAAMHKMKKIDLAALKKAYDG